MKRGCTIQDEVIALLAGCTQPVYTRDAKHFQTKIKSKDYPLGQFIALLKEMCKANLIRIRKLRDGTGRYRVKLLAKGRKEAGLTVLAAA